jgi:general secretion pathway protein C
MAIPDPALPTPGEDARRLAALHLFGVPTPEPPVTAAVPTSGPVTALKLVLHGTFAKGDSRNGQALISDPADTVEHYTVGDALPGGGTLAAIHTDRVILKRNGHYEMLPLWHDNVAFVVPATAPADTAGPSDGAPIIRELPRTLLDLANPQPVRKDGRFVGFRLTAIKDPRLLETLGLQPDDVITWINETDLDNPLKGMKALRRLSRGDYVNMAVQRDGQPMSLSFYLP